MEKPRSEINSEKEQRRENNRNSGTGNNNTDPDENLREIKEYYNALMDRKNKMSALVENIIKSPEREEFLRENTVQIKSSRNRSKMEYEVPLTVEPPVMHDISHVINDVFRDYLCRDVPGNKWRLFDSSELEKHLSVMEDIRRAEQDVMEVQERLLKATSDGGDPKIALKPRNVENYSLLEPRTFARKEKKCVNTTPLELNVKYCNVPETTRRLNSAKNKPENNTSGLTVNKKVIRFPTFKPGGVYKKTLIIRNSGKRLMPFSVIYDTSRRGNYFDYDYERGRLLAPGLTATLTVTFNCTTMEDTYDLINIIAKDNQTIDIVVSAENAIPILNYLVDNYDMDKTRQNSNHRGESQSVCVFECNACLVGATKTISVLVKLEGRSAKFVCVPENVCYSKSNEDIEWSRTMKLDAFEITPAIFKMDTKVPIKLDVTFKPRSSSFYCSKFIVVSDNLCAQDVNVFGDGQSFRPGEVLIEGQGLKKSDDGSTSDAETSYVLDMGEIRRVVVRDVCAKNTSRIKYPYRWIINHGIAVKPATKNAQINFNIHPSTGFLDKHTETTFHMECGVTDEIVNEQLTGQYRVTVTLAIDDVPKMSIVNQDIRFEEYEDCSEFVWIKIAEIDVISVYRGKERISLSVNPIVVDLNRYKLTTDTCVKERVEFVNKGTRPVHVTWIRQSKADTVVSSDVRVERESFEVAKRVKIDVRVEPKRPGRLRAVLNFLAKNDDGNTGHVVVYVRGTVDRTPELYVRPTLAPLDTVCISADASYNVEIGVKSNGGRPVDVRRRTYELDAAGTLRSVSAYGENAITTVLNKSIIETPVFTEVTPGISCQLTEWSSAASNTAVYTQTAVYAQLPDIRLNVNAVTATESLYRGVPHSFREIRLINNTPHCYVYAWGNPIGPDSKCADCEFNPANGTVNGNSFVEFELKLTPKISSYLLNKYWVPCFVQCNEFEPLQISVECRVSEFSATMTYVDASDRTTNITWRHDEHQWTTDYSTEEIHQTKNKCLEYEDNCLLLYEDNYPMSTTTSLDSFDFAKIASDHKIRSENMQETGNWRFVKQLKRDTPLRTSEVDKRMSNDSYSAITFENIECNIGTYISPMFTYGDTSKESVTFMSKKCCSIWIENDDEILNGLDEFKVSVWILATTWGRYDDVVIIELHVGTEVLPAIHIPLVIQAITFPIEFPFSKDIHNPTVEFSLYGIDVEPRLIIQNKSEIPILVSWHIYNDTKNKKLFGITLDNSNSNTSNPWSLRIGHYYGSETPQYFMIRPLVLKLGPKEQGFVTFFLNRTSEKSINRDENNMVQGTAVGTVTALESSREHIVRNDELKHRKAIVKLISETKHSIQPKLLLQTLDNTFQVSMIDIFNSQSSRYTINRSFTLSNRLRYPVKMSFEIDSPFVIKRLNTLRCGTYPGNATISVFYEDIIKIELQANIYTKYIDMPKMPKDRSARKFVQTGNLRANCENSYIGFKNIATFELRIYFPVLYLSASYINFDQVAVGETKSIDVMLSTYPGPEHFTAYSDIEKVFQISPTDGVVSDRPPVTLTITFKPKAVKQYSNNIIISTVLPMDGLILKVSGSGMN